RSPACTSGDRPFCVCHHIPPTADQCRPEANLTGRDAVKPRRRRSGRRNTRSLALRASHAILVASVALRGLLSVHGLPAPTGAVCAVLLRPLDWRPEPYAALTDTVCRGVLTRLSYLSN